MFYKKIISLLTGHFGVFNVGTTNIAPVIWAAAISAGGQFLSSRNSSNAASQAGDQSVEAAQYTADMNYKISQMNIAAENGRFEESMAWAKLIRQEDQLGGGDALQNQRYFDSELGWQTLLSPRGQQIVDASSRQDILNRTQLDANNRERENRDAQFQRGEQLTASQNKNAYDNVYRQDETALGDLIYAQGQQGRNENLDRLAEQNNMIYARNRGTAGFEQGQSQRAEQSAKSAETSRIDAVLRGKTLSRDITNNDLNNASKQYFDFRNASIKPWESSFMATNVGNLPDGGGDGNQMLSSALGQTVPQQPYIQTDFSQANNTLAQANARGQMIDAWGGLATAGYGIYQDRQNTNRQVNADLDTAFQNKALF